MYFVLQNAKLPMAENQKYYTVRIRVDKLEFEKFEEAKGLGITQKMILQAICKKSSDLEVVVFNKQKDKSIVLPKSFLCKKSKYAKSNTVIKENN